MDFTEQQRNTAKQQQKGQKSGLSVMHFMEQQRNTAKKRKRTEVRSVSNEFHGAKNKQQKTNKKTKKKSDLSVMDFMDM